MKVTILMRIACVTGWALLVCLASTSRADVFHQNTNQHSLDFVNVQNPGNAADFDPNDGNPTDGTPGASFSVGSVGYGYQISQTETPSSVWIEYANAVGANTNAIYHAEGMNSSTNDGSQVQRNGTLGSYTYQYNPIARDTDTQGRPIGGMSFYDAARLCNWLQAGQPTGPGAYALTDTGAYNLLASGDARRVVQPGAKYWIANENEWYKAAYYDPTKNGGAGGYWLYPTKSDAVPENTPFRVNNAIGPGFNPLGLHVNDDYQNPAWFVGHATNIPDPGNNANYLSNAAPASADSTWSRPFNINMTGGFMTEVGWFENSKSYYGTVDQGGNLWELMPSADGSTAYMRGGDYRSGGGNDEGIKGVSLAGKKVVPVGHISPFTDPQTDIRGGRIGIDPANFDLENYRFGWRIASRVHGPGDVNHDATVNIFDINFVSSHWGQTGPDGDANNDGTVNIFDINMISSNWGLTSGPGGGGLSSVPEPATVGLVASGLLVALGTSLLRSRRRTKSAATKVGSG